MPPFANAAPRARRQPLLLAAAVGAVVTGLGVFAFTVDRSPAAPAVAAAAPIAAPVGDPALAALRAEVQALRAEMRSRAGYARAAAAADPAASESAASPESPPPPLAPEAELAANNELAHKEVALYQNTLAADPIDPAWSREAEGRIRETFATLEVGDSLLDEVTCHSTLCRIAIKVSTPAAADRVRRQVAALVPWNTSGIGHDDEHDPNRVIVYAARTPDLAP